MIARDVLKLAIVVNAGNGLDSSASQRKTGDTVSPV
jgi:hypothetical protein